MDGGGTRIAQAKASNTQDKTHALVVLVLALVLVPVTSDQRPATSRSATSSAFPEGGEGTRAKQGSLDGKTLGFPSHHPWTLHHAPARSH